MSNPYFDFPISTSRFVPRSLARAEDVNARFDEVSYGFDLVTATLALKANLSGATFTGAVTFDSTTTFNAAATFNSTATGQSPGGVATNDSKFATTAWVQSVIGATSIGLPVQTTHNGKYLKTNGTSASWQLVAWSDISSKPTTLSGFGITDALQRPIEIRSNGALRTTAPQALNFVGASVDTTGDTVNVRTPDRTPHFLLLQAGVL